jgi:hypothetical protein
MFLNPICAPDVPKKKIKILMTNHYLEVLKHVDQTTLKLPGCVSFLFMVAPAKMLRVFLHYLSHIFWRWSMSSNLPNLVANYSNHFTLRGQSLGRLYLTYHLQRWIWTTIARCRYLPEKGYCDRL